MCGAAPSETLHDVGAGLELNHRVPRVPVVPDRHDFLVSRCRGRRVLHVGCVDAGLERERYDAREHLHARLQPVAEDLVGVDIDRAGLEFLRGQGHADLLLADVCEPGWVSELASRRFDVIVASEVLEHLDAPGAFLDAIVPLMTEGTRLIVTVPNAFGLEGIRAMVRGNEHVHPDHNYWFSFHTLTTLLAKHGYAVAELLTYAFRSRRRTLTRPVGTWLLRRNAFWGDGVIAVATLAGVTAAEAVAPTWIS